ncbi:hypothetical protein MYA_5729 [Burkholderia sp. KJ006]|nr:hypothetical protein MYA_5729 [Burkholderia sp. KJ006]
MTHESAIASARMVGAVDRDANRVMAASGRGRLRSTVRLYRLSCVFRTAFAVRARAVRKRRTATP